MKVNNSFPSLKILYFSAPPELDSFKFVDDLTRTTIEDPALLPCGHVVNSKNLKLNVGDRCFTHVN